MTLNQTAVKSCHNCKNCHSWYEPQTYWEPSDSGWECKLELDTGDDYPAGLDDAQLAQHFAKDCQSYEYQEVNDSDPPDNFIEPNPELELLNDTLRLRGMGLLDENFMPNDAFFEWV